jgi:hypothetical protein
MTTTSDTTKELVESEQNKYARLITGCIRPTRIKTLLEIANLPTLVDLANARAATLMERFQRLPTSTPPRTMANTKTLPASKTEITRLIHDFVKRLDGTRSRS